MANNRFKFDGLAELREGLRNFTPDAAAEATPIVFGAGDAAASAIVAGYPRRTGDLKDHVTVTKTVGQFSTRAIVKNTSKHASLFEVGTQARHTALGATRGTMPAGHVFVPAIVRQRRAMYEELKALLRRQGLTVSGDAG